MSTLVLSEVVKLHTRSTPHLHDNLELATAAASPISAYAQNENNGIGVSLQMHGSLMPTPACKYDWLVHISLHVPVSERHSCSHESFMVFEDLDAVVYVRIV